MLTCFILSVKICVDMHVNNDDSIGVNMGVDLGVNLGVTVGVNMGVNMVVKIGVIINNQCQ